MQMPTDDEPWAWAVFSEHDDVPCDEGTCDYTVLYDEGEAETACLDMNESHVDEGKEPGARVVPLVPFALVEQVRADLAASQREVERLRKIFDDAGQGEHNVLALVDHYQDAAIKADAEVKRCRGIVASLVAQSSTMDDGRLDSDLTVDMWATIDSSEALKYLAEIGRVEIVSEHGRRVVARWRS